VLRPVCALWILQQLSANCPWMLSVLVVSKAALVSARVLTALGLALAVATTQLLNYESGNQVGNPTFAEAMGCSAADLYRRRSLRLLLPAASCRSRRCAFPEEANGSACDAEGGPLCHAVQCEAWHGLVCD